MKLFVADNYNLTQQELDEFRAMGYEITVASPDQAPSEVCENHEEMEVALCEHFYLKAHLGEMPNLRMVQMTVAGLDLMPAVVFETYPNTKFYSGSGTYGVSLAEWSVGETLQILRQSALFEGYQREHQWKWDGSEQTGELWGKTVLVLGTGDIGRACARRYKAFDCTVIGLNTDGRPVQDFDGSCTRDDLPHVLPLCDVVCVAIPRTDKTLHMLDAAAMSCMKQGAVLVVNSRGRIVDEDKMCQMLDSGHLRGAALDCFDTEPLPADSPLWEQKNLIIYPHCGGVTTGLRERYIERYKSNLALYAQGKQPVGLIHYERGY